MKAIQIIIPGKPLVWSRPRVVARNGTVKLFDPKLAERRELGRQIKQFFPCPFDGPIKLEITAFYKAPSKARKGQGKTSRPDLDNCLKSYSDCLSQIAYLDDAQVVSIVASKLWGEKDEVHMSIIELDS